MSYIVLEAKNLVKNYGNVKAVRGISININAGEVVGLLGPNGAGKTTTIQMLLGLLEPSNGEIKVLGKPMGIDSVETLTQMNFAAAYAPLPGNLTVWENLVFFARLYGVANRKERILSLLKKFKLTEFLKTKAGLLSTGEQNRLSLAKAFINTPKLLLLDEPTASLDPDTADQMRTEIYNLAKNNQTAILWTSHNMYEMEQVCDRIIFISEGKILAQGTPTELIQKFKQKNLEQTFIFLARKQEKIAS